jgi:hypothetical protein
MPPTWFLAAASPPMAGLAARRDPPVVPRRLGVRVRKGAAVALTVVGLSLVVNWIIAVDRHLPWVRDEAAAFAKAKARARA